MGHMFYNCESLTSINFTNFDTSSVHFSMHWMFSGCNKLYSLDLSGFNTRYVECMENMFENCYSLTSLNLSNFDTSGLTCDADLMFSNCHKLEYINLENAFKKTGFYKDDMFNGIPKNTVFCVNSNAPSTFKSYTNLGCSNSNSACDNNWRENQNKIIESDRSCTDSCQAPNNKYDILNKCYDKCTIILFLKGICKIEYEDKDKFIEEIIDSLMKGELTELLFDNIVKGENVIGYNDNEIIQISILSSQNKASDMRSIYFGEYKYILHEKYNYDEEDELIIMKIHNKLTNSNDFLTDYILFSPDGKERLDLNLCKIPNVRQYNSSPNDTFLDYCYIKQFFNNECKIDHDNQDILAGDIINSILNGSLNSSLNEIKNNKVLIAENGTEIYQISTLSNQLKVRNSTYLDFGECEAALKKANNISENEELLLLKIEHNFTEVKIPIVEYTIFSPDGKKKLDLNECKDINIHQYIQIDINEDEIYKYDTNGDYYNDICLPYSENGIDKIVFDRKEEFNKNNMSLCEKNCNFNGYNSTNKLVDCECSIKESLVPFYNMTINSDSLLNKFKNIKNLINIEIFKCCKLLFSIQGLIKNYGSYIFLFLILSNSILIFVFYLKDYYKFKKNIFYLPDKMFNQDIKDKNKISHETKKGNRKNKIKALRNKLKLNKLNNPIKKNKDKNEKLDKSDQNKLIADKIFVLSKRSKKLVARLKTKNNLNENVNIEKQNLS